MMLARTALKAAAISVALSGTAQAADIVIGMPNWTTVQAKAHILKVVIEDNFGLDVEIQSGTNPVVFEGMDKGSMHVHPEVWLPNQQNLHDTYVNQKLSVVMSPNKTNSQNGMCVLRHTFETAQVKSITDLTNPQKAALFDSDGDGRGEIFIGAPGWASTVIEQVRARDYGYDETLQLLELEDAVAYGKLDSAAAAGKHWVGYCSDVHYMFQKHDVVLLEEPAHDPDSWHVLKPTDDPDWLAKSQASTGWKPANLHIHYAKSLQKDFPEVAALLDNVALTPTHLSELSFAMGVERRDPLEYANEWATENAELVASWLTN